MEKNVNMDGAYWKKKNYSLLFNFEYYNTIHCIKNKNRSIIVYIHIQVIVPYIL